MKKILFLSGLLAANLITAGALFKMMHWFPANILFTLGCLICILVFLPVALYQSYKEQNKYGLLHLIAYLVFGSGILSILFKVLHLTGANMLMQISMPLPFILFLPVYLYQTRHSSRTNDANFLGILFGLSFLAIFSTLISI